MGQLTDLSDILYTLTSGNSGNVQTIFITKKNSNYTNTLTGALSTGYFQGGYNSLIYFAGAPGFISSLPSTATVLDNTFDGSLKQVSPPSGQQQWLYNWTMDTKRQAAPMYMLYDRLCHMGGLSSTSTALQNVNISASTRYSGTSSVGNRIIVEVVSTIGTTTRNMTIKYTNQDNVSDRTVTITWGGGAGEQNISATKLVPLVSGDTGVRSVQSVQLDGSTLTAGNTAVAIIRPLNFCNTLGSSGTQNDLMNGVPTFNIEILPGACLCLLTFNPIQTSAIGMETTYGYITLVNK